MIDIKKMRADLKAELREKIGVMFGNPEVTAGGKALKFYASVRIDVRKADALKDSDGAFGNKNAIYGHKACGDVVISLTTRTQARLRQEAIQTHIACLLCGVVLGI